jgi:hypothetical protein
MARLPLSNLVLTNLPQLPPHRQRLTGHSVLNHFRRV